jgi:hypothetical protein
MFGDLRNMMHGKEKAKKNRRPVGLTAVSDPEMVLAQKREAALKPYILATKAEKQKRAVKKLLDAKYAEPERRLRAYQAELAVLAKERDRAVATFLSAKYAEIERKLAVCATELRSMGARYQTLKGVLMRLSAEYRRLRFLQRLEMIELETEQFSESFRSLANELNDDFIEPRARARRSIDNKLLSKMKTIAEMYLTTQQLVIDLTTVGRSVIEILDKLSSVTPERRELYRTFKLGQINLNDEITFTAHRFRTTYRTRRFTEGPLGLAHYFELLKDYGGTSRLGRKPKKLLQAVTSLVNQTWSIRHERRRWPCRRGDLFFVDITQRFYRLRLKESQRRPPRDPQLNIFWRHLDIFAPFETLRASTSAISQDIALLIYALRFPSPGLWSNLDVQARRRHVTNLNHTWYHFRQSHIDTTAEYQFLRSITWTRLRLESDIHSYGDTAPTLQSGLFTPKTPLSQDLSLFNLWLFQLNDLYIRAMEITDLLPKQKSLCKDPHLSQYQDIPEEPQEIDREFILGPVDEPGSNIKSIKSHRSRIVVRRVTMTKATAVTPVRTTTPNRPLRRHMKHLPKTLSLSGHRSKDKPARRPYVSQKEDRPAQKQPTTDSLAPQVSDKTQSKSKSLNRPDVEGSATPRKRSTRKRVQKSISSNDSRQSQRAPSPKKGVGAIPDVSGSRPRGVSKLRNMFAVEPRRGYSTGSRSNRNGPRDQAPKLVGCSAAKNSSEYASVTTKCSEVLLFDSERGNFDVLATETVSEDVLASQSCSQGDTERSTDNPYPQFWSHNMRTGPKENEVLVHYCKTLENAERIASLFLDGDIVGFDVEWKAQALASASIQNNVSLIQIANEERIALFHIALFRPGKRLEDLVVPSLKKLLESARTMKVGVSIKADCTRVRRYLGIDVQSQFELSHLYKLVKYAQSDPKLINKRAVNLSSQVEEHLGLPLNKDDDVRCSDWSRSLDYRQVQCEYRQSSENSEKWSQPR